MARKQALQPTRAIAGKTKLYKIFDKLKYPYDSITLKILVFLWIYNRDFISAGELTGRIGGEWVRVEAALARLQALGLVHPGPEGQWGFQPDPKQWRASPLTAQSTPDHDKDSRGDVPRK